MRIEQLQYLIELSKTRSMNIAASNLYISQPTISEAIKKLEQELNVKLLNRSKTGVSLTSVGKQIVEVSQHIVTQTGEIEAIVSRHIQQQKQAEQFKGYLKIGSVGSVVKSIIPNMITPFSDLYPDVNYLITEESIPTILTKVLEDKIDLGILFFFEDSLPHSEFNKLHFEFISNEFTYALVGLQSPLANKEIIIPRELMKYPLAFYSHDIDDTYVLDCIFPDLKPLVKLISNSEQLLHSQITENNLVGIMLSPSLKLPSSTIKDMRFIPIKNAPAIKFGFIYKEDSIRLEELRIFMNLLKKLF